jgi:hypothetical protein
LVLEQAFGKPPPPLLVQANTAPNTFYSLTANGTLTDGTTVYFNSGEWGTYFGLVRMQAPDASPHQLGI